MGKEQLTGTWKLVSCALHRRNGEVLYPFGTQPVGRLMYDSTGQMAYLNMRPGRALFASASKLGGTPEEIQAAFDGFDAYFGTYEVSDAESKVRTTSKVRCFPIGSGRTRYASFSAPATS